MPAVMTTQRSTTNGSALARVQAVSPGFRASLVQPSLRFVLSASLQGWVFECIGRILLAVL